MINKLTSTLYGRLTAALLLSFVVVGVFAAILMVHSSRAYQQEITQVMHRDLAAHVVDHYLLFENDEPNLEEAEKTFHDLMILGPNFEFYLLDKAGKIVACSADPSSLHLDFVDTKPIGSYLQSPVIQEPIFGDDPRGIDREKIFSVAPIVRDGELQGYLYVILGSEIYDRVSDLVLESKIIQWGLWVFLIGLAFSLFATLG